MKRFISVFGGNTVRKTASGGVQVERMEMHVSGEGQSVLRSKLVGFYSSEGLIAWLSYDLRFVLLSSILPKMCPFQKGV